MVSNGQRCLSITINPAGINGISRVIADGFAVLIDDGRPGRSVDGHGFVDVVCEWTGRSKTAVRPYGVSV